MHKLYKCILLQLYNVKVYGGLELNINYCITI